MLICSTTDADAVDLTTWNDCTMSGEHWKQGIACLAPRTSKARLAVGAARIATNRRPRADNTFIAPSCRFVSFVAHPHGTPLRRTFVTRLFYAIRGRARRGTM